MITYHNLTQNIEGDRFIYLRSTDVEQHNYHRLLWSIPDEMLFFMSKGEDILVIDKTSNTNGGKIRRIFLPAFEDMLNFVYFKNYSLKHTLLSAHTKLAISAMKEDRSLKRKYMFWKDKIKYINILGASIIVDKEPNPLEGK